MLKGDGGEVEQRVWVIWYLLLEGISHVPLHLLHPNLHLPCGTALQGGGEGMKHCTMEGINWCHLFGAHGQSI